MSIFSQDVTGFGKAYRVVVDETKRRTDPDEAYQMVLMRRMRRDEYQQVAYTYFKRLPTRREADQLIRSTLMQTLRGQVGKSFMSAVEAAEVVYSLTLLSHPEPEE